MAKLIDGRNSSAATFDASKVDPDPFVVAAVCLNAAAVVLQLVQTWKAFHPSAPPSSAGNAKVAHTQLDSLERESEKLRRGLDRLLRAAERGGTDVEDQLYAAPTRIAQTELLLDPASHESFGNELADSFGALSGLSRWISHIIRSNPGLAYRLGERLGVPLEEVANQLNRAMAEGRPIREIINETKLTLRALEAAIQAESGSGN